MNLASRSPAKSSSRSLSRSNYRRTRLGSPDFPFLQPGPQERKHQHGQENRKQSRGGLKRAALLLRQNRKSSIDKFDVNPVHQQRGIPELDDGAEPFLRKPPAAPRINQKKNQKQDATAQQKKIRIAVPIVVNRIQPDARGIEENRQGDSDDSRPAKRREHEPFAALGGLRKQKEAGSKSGEGERRPRKQRKEPGLWLAKNVNAVNVGFDRPRQELRPVRGPERRSSHRDSRRHENRRHQRANSRRCNGAISRQTHA